MGCSRDSGFNFRRDRVAAAYPVNRGGVGAPLPRRRTSCLGSCYSFSCSGSLSVWIAVVVIGFTIEGLVSLAIIGIVLLLITGAFGVRG
jgi:hypothetical protein